MFIFYFILFNFDNFQPFKHALRTNKNSSYFWRFLSPFTCTYFFHNLRLGVLIKGVLIKQSVVFEHT